MGIVTADEFLQLLEKSQLLKREQFETAQAMRERNNPKGLAEKLVNAKLLTEWQAAQILTGRSTFFLGRYKLLELLGRGGMGGVFLAEHVTMNRRVALKTISRHISQESGALDRFLAEARTIAALDHPNIVQAYSIDNEGERFYLVMEFVEGEDLEHLVQRRGPLDYVLAADCIRQAALGLHHGHCRNIIHCDIKPSNLLMNQQGVVKIVDMGLAQLQDSEKGGIQKQGDTILGSVDYLSPEQALEGEDFNHRADIYSLGCTLYFLLTGQPPFPTGSITERLIKHQAVEPESLLNFRSDLPDELVAICEKMMAKDPEERYQSAEVVAEALTNLPPPGRNPKTPKPARRPAGRKESESTVLDEYYADEMERLAGQPTSGKSPAGSSKNHAVSGSSKRLSGSGKSSNRLVRLKNGGSGTGITLEEEQGVLETPLQKILASMAVGIIAVGLLTLLVIYVLRSPDPNEIGVEQRWLLEGAAQGRWLAEPRRDSSDGAAGATAADAGQNPRGIRLGPWYATDPLPVERFAEPQFPEAGVELEAKTPDGKPRWRELTDFTDGEPFALPGGKEVATYLFRKIQSDGPALLPAGFGSDDGLEVWLNGRKLLSVDQARTVEPDSNRADLALRAGDNDLLLKVFNREGAHGFYFAADLKGARPSDSSSEKPPSP